MALTDLTTSRTRVRVPMVVAPHALVLAPLADLRGVPSDDAELVDQLHFRETARVLGSRDGWHHVQAQDHYFGWIPADLVHLMPGPQEGRVVGRLLAPIRRDPEVAADVVGYLAAGTPLPTRQTPPVAGDWVAVSVTARSKPDGASGGFVSLDDAVGSGDLPHRPPTADDLIATARAFLGTPYLWGGTSGQGIDCSGFVQQVYRLNGVGLDRDADQQAHEGRAVDVPIPGDLLFFGSPNVTHVALSLGGDDLIHAPLRGGFVEERKIGPDRIPVATRRYLLEPGG